MAGFLDLIEGVAKDANNNPEHQHRAILSIAVSLHRIANGIHGKMESQEDDEELNPSTEHDDSPEANAALQAGLDTNGSLSNVSKQVLAERDVEENRTEARGDGTFPDVTKPDTVAHPGLTTSADLQGGTPIAKDLTEEQQAAMKAVQDQQQDQLKPYDTAEAAKNEPTAQ